MKTQEKCKYCDYVGMMQLYIKPFATEMITAAYQKDNRLPKYGFHYGSECPKCIKWQKWEKQDDILLDRKFYDGI